MRLTFVAVLVWYGVLSASVTAELVASESPAAEPLSAVEARKHVGEKVLVQMEVRAAKDRLEKRGEIYLDADEDFRSERNFAAVITRRGAESLAAKEVRDPAEHFRGKTIRVRGTVKEVDGVPRIEIDDAEQIQLVDKK